MGEPRIRCPKIAAELKYTGIKRVFVMKPIFDGTFPSLRVICVIVETLNGSNRAFSRLKQRKVPRRCRVVNYWLEFCASAPLVSILERNLVRNPEKNALKRVDNSL